MPDEGEIEYERFRFQRFQEQLREQEKKKCVTPDDILEIARRNPFVYRALKFWKSGDVTFNEAMMLAVKWLDEDNTRLAAFAEIVKATQVPDAIIIKNDKEIS